MNDNFFYKLKNPTDLRMKILTYLKSEKRKFTIHHDLYCHKIPLELSLSDRCIDFLHKSSYVFFNSDIFKMLPNTFYVWHHDHERKCSLNLFLEGEDSQCLMAEESNLQLFNYCKVPYDQNYFCLLNNQKKHCIINGENTRYILSLGFKIEFDLVKKLLNENNF